MKKKLLSLVCAAAMMLSLAACGSANSDTPASPEASDPAAVRAELTALLRKAVGKG